MVVGKLQTAKKVIGAKQTAKAAEKGTAAIVYLAEDAEKRIINPIREMCNAKGVEVEMVPTMNELGKWCGIEVGAAAVALLK